MSKQDFAMAVVEWPNIGSISTVSYKRKVNYFCGIIKLNTNYLSDRHSHMLARKKILVAPVSKCQEFYYFLPYEKGFFE